MRREWETVLGEKVLFREDPRGGWRWECEDLNVKADAAVRYSTQGQARLAAAAMIYAFFVLEEVTGTLIPPLGALFISVPCAGGGLSCPPPQGGGGV